MILENCYKLSYLFLQINSSHIYYDILTAFSRIFTQVPKTFNSPVALQEGFLKRLGDTVLLDSVCLSLFCFYMPFRVETTILMDYCN